MKAFICWLGLTGLWGLSITLIITFMQALYHGSAVLVLINEYNEQWIELLLILFFLYFMLLFTYEFFKEQGLSVYGKIRE